MFRLKKGIEEFEMVDGAFAGRKFKRGVLYAEVPPGEKRKFDEIKEETVKQPKRGSKVEAAAAPEREG